MTFLEKLKRDKPNAKIRSIVFNHCPYEYDYEEYFECEVDIVECPNECEKCWNREMPDTEKAEQMDSMSEIAYTKGLVDGYNLVARINDYTYEQLSEIFGMVSLRYILKTFTPDEAVAKMEEYENGKIEVGDVIEQTNVDERFIGVVVRVEKGDRVTGLLKDGKWFSSPCGCHKKTGKHIDIKAILEQIGE